MTEHIEQVGLFAILALYEDKHPQLKWIYAIPNGGFRHPATAVKMKAEGVKSGVWDIRVPYPAHGKLGMYIEMKWDNNKLTPNQKAFQRALGELYEWRVCYDRIEAAQAIGEYLHIEELERIT